MECSSMIQRFTNKAFFIIAALCCFFWGQPATAAVTWHKTYSGAGNGGAVLQETSSGGIIVGGDVTGGPDNTDIGLFKLDGEGSIAWQKAYGSMYFENIVSISQTSDGGYVVGGTTARPGNFVWETRLVMKLDALGNIEWQKTLDHGFMFSVRQTRDGGYIVGSRDTFFAAAIKLDPSGNIEWVKSFNNTAYQGIKSIEQTPDGGYIMASGMESLINGVWREGGWIAKLDAGGNIVWQKTCFDSVPSNRVLSDSIQQTRDGGYIVKGRIYSEVTFKTASWVARLNAAGGLVWQKSYGGGQYGDAIVTGLYEKTDGNFLMAMTNTLLTVDPNGNVVQGLRATRGTFRFSPAPAADGGYLGVGSMRLDPAWNADFMIIKLDETGNASLCGLPFMTSYQETAREATAVFSDSAIPGWSPARISQPGDLVTRELAATAQAFCADPDITPPVSTAVISGTNGANGWYVTDTVITLTATDAESGVKEIRFTVDGSETLIPADSTSFTVGEGVHTVVYYGVDNAGNAETAHPFTIQVDGSAPVITISGIQNTGTYELGLVPTAAYGAVDAVSGVASSTASLTGGDGLGLGTFTYTVTASDIAGNNTVAAVTYQVIASPNGTAALVNSAMTSGQVDPNTASSLLVKLDGVQQATNATAADGKLRAFINEINAQVGKKITAEAAAILINAAIAMMNNN